MSSRITEKRLLAVSPQTFTANGNNVGQIKVADASLFRVKQDVSINATGLPELRLEVKKVLDINTLFVGPDKGSIDLRTDISAYTTALGANISADQQNRPNIPEEAVERATYEDEPVVARRVVMVDKLGDIFDDDNPLPIAFDGTVNIGDVRITAQDNDPKPGDIHSSVRISDGTNDVRVNPDGSINVVVESGGGGVQVVNQYNSISSVPAGPSTSLLTYTVPVGKKAFLFRIEYGGDNFARFDVTINAAPFATGRTWYGNFKETFEFAAAGADGYQLNAGDIVQVFVVHNRPFLGAFEARLQASLV